MDNKSNELPIFTVDAFASKPFCGNGAAVCLLPYHHEADNNIKQKVAAEINLSETAFLKAVNPEDNFQNGKQFYLQWFTPTCEVSLCGHATLASAAVLFFECKNESEVLEFKTISGVLKAKRLPNNKIEIDLPAYESESVVGEFENLVQAAIGKLPVQSVVLSEARSRKLLIQLSDEVSRKEFEAIKVNSAELLSASSYVNGLIVTLKGVGRTDCVDENGIVYDFVSRYFGPWTGIPEDPVTGSAHSVLAPHWAKVLQKKEFYARQCSKRGGELHVKLQDGRVLISGDAVVVIRGQINF